MKESFYGLERGICIDDKDINQIMFETKENTGYSYG